MFINALPERRDIAGISIELLIKGQGQPLLFLHAGHGIDAGDKLVDELAKSYRVIAPSHPGFGASELPRHMTTTGDLVYFYLDLIEELDLKDLIVVGVSFGGWLAAELATCGTGRISKLVLIDAVGVKFSDRETRDIVDIFARPLEEIPTLFFHDQDKAMTILGGLDFKSMSLDSATRFARNRESLLLFGWSPTLYNPKLRSRLHRVHVPVLVLWGADDSVTSPAYGKQYAAAFEHGTYEEVADAGHYGYLEQPEKFAEKIAAFLAAKTLIAA
jgi:pimeloyl-ACP methyl ester carboxylesterase